MKKVFFTADTHFEHAVLQAQYRQQWDSVDNMNEGIIKMWNYHVDLGDTVYHLGDFAWYHPELFVDRLNGRINLILGNHDDLKKWQREMFASVQEVKWLSPKQIKHGTGLYLSHYPHRSWRSKEYGSMHLYGHCHGNIPDFGRSMDVGWDVWGRPVSLEEIKLNLLQRDIHQLYDGDECQHIRRDKCTKGSENG